MRIFPIRLGILQISRHIVYFESTPPTEQNELFCHV